MIHFLGSVLSVAISLIPLIEAHTRYTKFLSEVCVEQHLKALVYVCGHVY